MRLTHTSNASTVFEFTNTSNNIIINIISANAILIIFRSIDTSVFH